MTARAPHIDVPARLAEVAARASRLAEVCREGMGILEGMLGHLENPEAYNAGVARLDALGEEAAGLDPAYALAQRLSVLGVLERARADRADLIADWRCPVERRRGRVLRDLANLRALGRSAAALAVIATPPDRRAAPENGESCR